MPPIEEVYMATQDTSIIQTFYSGEPGDKLAVARRLLVELADLPALPSFHDELEQLHNHCQTLDAHMQAMDLGRLCTQCAARPGGGCCSAYMADNTDAIQLLINLLLGATVTEQADSGENCCFLGPRGCCFPVKPIFCLNYNCTHILDQAKPEQLHTLYRRVAAVLSQQTRIESLLLEELRQRHRSAA
jgi:hypothetical protein